MFWYWTGLWENFFSIVITLIIFAFWGFFCLWLSVALSQNGVKSKMTEILFEVWDKNEAVEASITSVRSRKSQFVTNWYSISIISRFDWNKKVLTYFALVYLMESDTSSNSITTIEMQKIRFFNLFVGWKHILCCKVSNYAPRHTNWKQI